MPVIAVVFTGGTIGSRVRGGTADVDEGASRSIVERFQRDHPDSPVRFKLVDALSTLSENMTVDTWNVLLDALRRLPLPRLDGVLIAHGTDTLAYTAGLLSAALSGVPVPVILVSSHTPPEDPQANGHRHFAAAVDYIVKGRPAGVYAAITDGEGAADGVVFARGDTITQCAPLTHRFGVAPARPFIQTAGPPPLYRLPLLKPCVTIVQPYPGLDYRAVSFPPGTRAVLHGLYHSGTACVQGERTGIGALARRCREAGVTLFVCPAAGEDGGYRYATAVELLETMVHPLWDRTLESAYGLLLIGCALCADEADLLKFVNGAPSYAADKNGACE